MRQDAEHREGETMVREKNIGEWGLRDGYVGGGGGGGGVRKTPEQLALCRALCENLERIASAAANAARPRRRGREMAAI